MFDFRSLGFHLLLAVSAVAIFAAPSQAAIIWAEGSPGQGDLSNNQAAPTPLALSLGVNSVLGSVQGPATLDSQDWITLHVPAGLNLVSMILKSYTSTDPQGFSGFQRGTSFVGNPLTAGPYVGYAHFGTAATNPSPPGVNLVGADLLPLMANPAVAAGAQGFTLPLGPGDYTFLIQQTGGTKITFQFDFITAPEPATIYLLGIIFAVVLARQGIGRVGFIDGGA